MEKNLDNRRLFIGDYLDKKEGDEDPLKAYNEDFFNDLLLYLNSYKSTPLALAIQILTEHSEMMGAAYDSDDSEEWGFGEYSGNIFAPAAKDNDEVASIPAFLTLFDERRQSAPDEKIAMTL